MEKIPEISSIAGSRHHIAFGFRYSTMEAEASKQEASFMEVGKDYIKTMQLKISSGRDFDPSSEADYQDALLITQTLATRMGWKEKEAIGKRIRIDSSNYSVIGVLKDFHVDNVFNPLDPVAMKLAKENKFQFLVMQAKPDQLSTVYSKLNDT